MEGAYRLFSRNVKKKIGSLWLDRNNVMKKWRINAYLIINRSVVYTGQSNQSAGDNDIVVLHGGVAR
jgi:hypothetical protein